MGRTLVPRCRLPRGMPAFGRAVAAAGLALAWISMSCTAKDGSPADQGWGGEGQASGGGNEDHGAGGAGSGGADGAPQSGGKDNGPRKSELGSGCVAKNDCAAGDSCVRGRCQPASFALMATGKECFVVDCATTEDCCGALSSDIPDKCRARAATCSAELPGCTPHSCNRALDCGGGGTCLGRCSVTDGACAGGEDCLENICTQGACSLDFKACKVRGSLSVGVRRGALCLSLQVRQQRRLFWRESAMCRGHVPRM
jgi:hypothetical protein